MELKHEKELNSSMSMDFKHIGLQVVEKDIIPFYEEVLGFISKHSFELGETDSNKIFGINKNILIIYGSCGNIDFELFVNNSPKDITYNHICIQVNEAHQISRRAQERGYKVFKRKGRESETFFITDSNSNVFEVKSL